MRIKWFGQSCFMITSESGVTIITDPFGKLPYRLPDVQPDIVTVSHNHMDHNNTKALKGNFKVFKEPAETEMQGVTIRGVETCHDNAGGKKRGKNIVFILTVDGIAICHLGDLGHILADDQIKRNRGGRYSPVAGRGKVHNRSRRRSNCQSTAPAGNHDSDALPYEGYGTFWTGAQQGE